jgi:hypothetical protein
MLAMAVAVDATQVAMAAVPAVLAAAASAPPGHLHLLDRTLLPLGHLQNRERRSFMMPSSLLHSWTDSRHMTVYH